MTKNDPNTLGICQLVGRWGAPRNAILRAMLAWGVRPDRMNLYPLKDVVAIEAGRPLTEMPARVAAVAGAAE